MHPTWAGLSSSEVCELTNETVDFGPIFQCWTLQLVAVGEIEATLGLTR